MLALTAAPGGFTAAEFSAEVRHLTQHDDNNTRQAACDLRKLRGKKLIDKSGRTRASASHWGAPAPSPRCSPSATHGLGIVA